MFTTDQLGQLTAIISAYHPTPDHARILSEILSTQADPNVAPLRDQAIMLQQMMSPRRPTLPEPYESKIRRAELRDTLPGHTADVIYAVPCRTNEDRKILISTLRYRAGALKVSSRLDGDTLLYICTADAVHGAEALERHLSAP